MTDIEKVKIDILRDSLKDAMDTVRALDRKIVFLISFNAIFLGLISTLFFKKDVLKEMLPYIDLFYCILGAITLVWIIVLIFIMTAIAPKSNPIEVFKKEDDKKFSNNTFFVFTNGDKESLDLNNLLDGYKKINSYTKIQKLLYKEIGKLSYIRDTKLNSIKTSVLLTQGMVSIFLAFIVVFLFLKG